jgi:Protein of unknown function (DUF429)
MGVDFSCAPDVRKPITVAWGERRGPVVRLDGLEALPSLDHFTELLTDRHPRWSGGWLGGFDFPFGLPRVFVDAWQAHGAQSVDDALGGEPFACDALIRSLRQACRDRQGFQALIDQWGQNAPSGWGEGTRPGKLPHRRCDTALPGTSSTSPLQTRYVPVGKMYFEGLSRLVEADIGLPGLRTRRSPESAWHLGFEAYPGLLATEVLGKRSYKSDDKARQTDDLLVARLTLIDALEQGRTRLGLRLKLSPAQRDHLACDAKGDRLDAVLCLLQAGWAHLRWQEGDARAGIPADVDPVEGWILTA